MKRFQWILLLTLILIHASAGWSAEMFVYFGSHRSGPGIGFSLARFNTDTGELTKPQFLLEAPAPAFYVFDSTNKHLYVSNSIDTFEGKPEGTISSYSVDAKTGALKLLNSKLAGGADPSFISLDKTEKFAFVANYRGGNISAHAVLPDGSFGERTAFVQHTGSSVHPQRQTRPYAHSIINDPSNRFLLVPDLGVDKVFIYKFDEKTGAITPNDPPALVVPPGSGPRHVRFHPNGKWVFVICEISSTVLACEWDGTRGALTQKQVISALPADFKGTSTSAELEIHPNGKFAYASNRGHESLAVFAIDQASGQLSLIQHISSAGKTPRNFAIDPTNKWLIVTNHGSDNTVIYSIDQMTGKLTQKGEPISVTYPFCPRFLPIEK
jgi:6-phosphogluconolactonase